MGQRWSNHQSKGIGITEGDLDGLRNEMMFEAVKSTVKSDPNSWACNLESLGFSWVDDDDGRESIEEYAAKPENAGQKLLVDYFEGNVEFSVPVLRAFLDEKNAAKPNYPLIRKYFRCGNKRLKELLFHALESFPADIDLLNDVCFFHSNCNVLKSLITVFIRACEEETDPDKFRKIALLFHFETSAYSYAALHELGLRFDRSSLKGKIISEINSYLQSIPEDIEF
ncbi:MAG: hypothetical protein HQL78_13745 [Magnetococcales bacterium]|nr:hypothetical protein [Magnetococcales bacterium]